jgi:serine protease Do
VTSIDRSVDIALLKVDGYAKLPPPLALGDTHSLKAGQWAIAIGEPLELKPSVTVGVVSAFNRSEAIGDSEGGQARKFVGLLQTSAPINPGNPGGPLIDMAGRVIGINQAVAGGAQGIGFAIPIETVRRTVATLQQQPAAGPDVASIQGPSDASDAQGDSSEESAPSEGPVPSEEPDPSNDDDGGE